MSRSIRLAAALAAAALLGAGLILWRDHGAAVWLEQGLAYCF
jgi:hypothetical protein